MLAIIAIKIKLQKNILYMIGIFFGFFDSY